jgi:hypothetical protein
MISPSTPSATPTMPDLQPRRATLDKPVLSDQSGSTGAAPANSTADSKATDQAGSNIPDKTITVNQNDFRPALSPLTDEDAAAEATQSIGQSILAQPGAALLAQANLAPENAERLLQ